MADGERLLLHFGAVDWAATVWVNGSLVVRHEGGYTPFYADITDALLPSGEQTVVVRADDDPADLGKPRGKQDWQLEPHSIWYPRTTGIWQTVWMERVPEEWVDRLDLVPLDMGGFNAGNAQCMAIRDCVPFGGSGFAPDTVVIDALAHASLLGTLPTLANNGAVVHQLQGFLVGLHFHDADNRAEALLHHDPHRVIDIRQNLRREIGRAFAGGCEAFGIDQRFRAHRDRCANQQ